MFFVINRNNLALAHTLLARPVGEWSFKSRYAIFFFVIVDALFVPAPLSFNGTSVFFQRIRLLQLLSPILELYHMLNAVSIFHYLKFFHEIAVCLRDLVE